MITAAKVRELLIYEPETGRFIWRVDRGTAIKAGSAAGYTRSDGYKIFSFTEHGHYLGHRLAWLYMTGEWPPAMVDHINGDPSDNRWANLRAATRSQNMMNMALPPRNTSGVKGVSFNRRYQVWEAYITVGRRRRKLGTHKTIEAAAAARRDAELALFGPFARSLDRA